MRIYVVQGLDADLRIIPYDCEESGRHWRSGDTFFSKSGSNVFVKRSDAVKYLRDSRSRALELLRSQQREISKKINRIEKALSV